MTVTTLPHLNTQPPALDNTDYTATIEGHADEQGTREYNLALGARRANAAILAERICGAAAFSR